MESQHHTPYAGQESRTIKALSEDEVMRYRGGHGMGLAKAAELNHYPGPKHALELASRLGLSAEQHTAVKSIYDRMHARAVDLGERVIAKEETLDSLFAAQAIDSTSLHRAVTDIARLQGELRAVHLLAHVEMKSVLSREQIAQYDEWRGYGKSATGQQASSPPPAGH
jgi:Spy/CpxP family protein refolding chaperone